MGIFDRLFGKKKETLSKAKTEEDIEMTEEQKVREMIRGMLGEAIMSEEEYSDLQIIIQALNYFITGSSSEANLGEKYASKKRIKSIIDKLDRTGKI